VAVTWSAVSALLAILDRNAVLCVLSRHQELSVGLTLAGGSLFLFWDPLFEGTRRHGTLGDFDDGLHCFAEARVCFLAFDHFRVRLHGSIMAHVSI
jgi:hypothetical protein